MKKGLVVLSLMAALALSTGIAGVVQAASSSGGGKGGPVLVPVLPVKH